MTTTAQSDIEQPYSLDELLRARFLATSGIGRRARISSRTSLDDIRREMERRGVHYSQPNLSRIERSLRKPSGHAGVVWGQIIDELLAGAGLGP